MNGGRGFFCRRCGEFHPELPLSYAIEAPAAWYELPDEDRNRRSRLTATSCIIDGRSFYVSGSLKIPIIGAGQVLTWGIWVEVNLEDFQVIYENLDRHGPGPISGRLASEIPGYDSSSLDLKAWVHIMLPGVRSHIELKEGEHLLATEQRNGITWERVQQIAEHVIHGPETTA